MKKEKLKKPPIGLMPKYLWDDQRLFDVCAAITRYYQACLEIPIDWVEEYNSFMRIKNTKKYK